jgi:hypothetical protein
MDDMKIQSAFKPELKIEPEAFETETVMLPIALPHSAEYLSDGHGCLMNAAYLLHLLAEIMNTGSPLCWHCCEGAGGNVFICPECGVTVCPSCAPKFACQCRDQSLQKAAY